MKNFTLTLCFVFALVVNVFAQESPAAAAIDKASSTVSRLMVQSLRLNEGEYIQLKALNKERLAKAAEITKMYGNDLEVRDARLQEVDGKFEGELFKLLNSRQVEAYTAFKAMPEGNFMALVKEVTKTSKN